MSTDAIFQISYSVVWGTDARGVVDRNEGPFSERVRGRDVEAAIRRLRKRELRKSNYVLEYDDAGDEIPGSKKKYARDIVVHSAVFECSVDWF